MTQDSPPKKAKTRLSNNKQDNKQEEACPWHINSPKHYDCLWIYIIDKSGPDGSMAELTQSDIAQLLGWSNTKTHFALKEAMAALVEALHKCRANQLISTDPDQIIDFHSFNIEPAAGFASSDSED